MVGDVNFLAVVRRLVIFRRVLALLARHRGRVALGLAAVPAGAALSLWMPRLVGEALDLLRPALGDAPPDARGRLAGLCGLFVAAAFGHALLRYCARVLLIDASREVERELKDRLFAHVSRLPIAWFDRLRTGDLISRFTQDVELVRFVVGPLPLWGGTALVVLPAGLWLMTSLSPLVTAAAAAVFVLLLVSLALLMPGLHRASREVQESIGRISQRAAEDFAGIRVLTTFGRGKEEAREMLRLGDDYVRSNMRLARLRSLLNLMIHTCRDLVAVSVLVVGGIEAVRGHLTIGDLAQFLMYLEIMVWPLIVTGWLLALAPRALAAAERIEEVFETPTEPRGGAAPELRGSIEVSNLWFRYEGAPEPALRGVSFRLEPGRKLGLVGPVGSGKSTLIALLLRLYDPPRGTVFVDGHDVLDLDPRALRSAFALAPQDPFLFSDTVRGNVAFAGASGGGTQPAGVGAAVRVAALAQDLDRLPEGLDSIVGERGITLSGGQKQRVSMARALAADRTALVLDDSLSAVDHETEARILAGLEKLRGRRTMLVAAHRLSAVADADVILVLDRGRVVERGTHAELLARDGYYAEVWALQREEAALEGSEEEAP